MEDFLSVKPGDPITADIWQRLLKSVDRSNTLYGGDNTRVTKTPHGTLVNAKHTYGWIHPWKVSVSKTTATVWPGLINGVDPVMTDITTGQDKKLTERPPPLLPLKDTSFNANNIGWIALELETQANENDKNDPPNKYAEIKSARVIQCQLISKSELNTKNPYFYFGLPGITVPTDAVPKVRYPLARLQRVGKKQIAVYQVAMFNLNWKAKPPQPSGGGTGATAIGSAFPRHFFWPS